MLGYGQGTGRGWRPGRVAGPHGGEGATGNKPQATTEHEYYEAGDLDAPVRSFFDLRPEDIESVLQLNFSGTLIPTQVFAQDMLGRGGCSILNISSMNADTPLTKIPA